MAKTVHSGGQVNDSQVTLTLTQDLICTAQFEVRQETLKVEKQGAGNVSDLLGIDCGEICQVSYPTGTLITLVAVPEENNVFQSWQGQCGQSHENTTTITLDTSETCTAIFVPKSGNSIPTDETLMIETANGRVIVTTSEILSCQDTCTYHYPKDTSITLEAKADEGYRLVQWQGDCGESKANLISVALNTSKTCLAKFEQIEEPTPAEEYRLQVIVQGLGQVTSEPAGINCSPDSQQRCVYTSTFAATVKLTALPANDNEFTGWEGDCQGQEASRLVPMAKNKVCTARFEPVNRIEFEQSFMLVTEFGEVSTLGKRGHFITLPIKKSGDDPVTVPWQVVDGTAKVNEDYIVVSPPTLTGSTGEQLKGIEVFIIDDEVPEVDETFKIALSPPLGFTQLGTVNQIEVVIQDNDKTTSCTLPLQPARQTLSLMLSSSVTQLVLSPREHGQTQIELDNCAHQPATVDIVVLKSNTLAYFCELDHRHDGLCVNPDETKSIDGNSMAVDAKGEPIEIPVNWQTQLIVQSPQPDEIPIVSSADELTVQVTTISEQLSYQTAELIVLLEDQGEFYFPTVNVHTLVPDEASKVGESQANEWDTPTLSIRNQLRSMVSSSWPRWNKQLADLKAVKLIDQLAAIHEETFSFNLPPDLNGELTLYIGYRLEGGRLVFNGHWPIHFVGANSMILSPPGEYQDSRAYFKSQVQTEGEQINILTQIYPAPEHLHQKGDLIMVAVYLSPQGKVLSFSRSASEQWQPWDGQLGTLEIAETNIPLTEPITTEVFLGNLNYLVGTVTLYLGYRPLAEGTIVFNGKTPVVLTLP